MNGYWPNGTGPHTTGGWPNDCYPSAHGFTSTPIMYDPMLAQAINRLAAALEKFNERAAPEQDGA